MELYIRVKTLSSSISLHHSSQTSIRVFESELFKYRGLIYITEWVKLQLNIKQCRPSQHQKKVMPILNIALVSSLHFTVSLKKNQYLQVLETPFLYAESVTSTENWTVFSFCFKNTLTRINGLLKLIYTILRLPLSFALVLKLPQVNELPKLKWSSKVF